MKTTVEEYKDIIVGAGAAGLYCAAMLKTCGKDGALVLEKTERAGTKLLCSGGGQCNITHGGSVKDFINCYGENGRRIRGVLQRYSNLRLQKFMESLGVPLTEREDGKIFPRSMRSRDVLDALLKEIAANGSQIRFKAPVTGILPPDKEGLFTLHTPKGTFRSRNVIIASGGSSYPSTGSDGRLLDVLARDLGIAVEKPAPSLTPVYVENYRYASLSGMSFSGITMTAKKTFRGDLLFTEKNLSGPLVLNNSRYLKPGGAFTLNFLAPASGPEVVARLKKDFPGNGKSPQTYMAEDLKLPRRFAQQTASILGISENKVSQLSGKQIEELAKALTEAYFKVSGLGGFKEAMATRGGVSLEEVNLTSMGSKKYPGLYFIGEVCDIDGDTGGYNLQFAFSSACAAADAVMNER